ncbi:MAG: hypothetical protein M3O02_12970 [Acidobacteriota bacterium]|nr:hypothetical protein [Acidobacteriota bacterium]
MHGFEEWLKLHKIRIGVAADFLTFGGGLLLARDAFRHVVDLRAEQLEEAFRKRFAQLAPKLVDNKEAEARGATRMAYRGLALLILGFLFQILSRFAE